MAETKLQALANIKRDPLGHLVLEDQLRQAGFRGAISSDKEHLEVFSTDESIFSIKPQLIIQPATEEDVKKAVKVVEKISSHFPNISLTPRAAGTGLSGGSLTDSIVIDVSANLTEIGEVTVKKGVAHITVEPGAMWRDVEKSLAEYEYYLPSAPASKDICSIGGAVANNAAGPDSLRYGHTADWVESLEVVLRDGNKYTIKPLTYKEFQSLIKKKHAYATIAREIMDLIEQNEETINKAKPKTKKNTAGYALWDVLDVSVKEFKKGVGKFDLTRLISGSQGTLGIVTKITLRATPIHDETSLIAVPVFDLHKAGVAIQSALSYNPINIEIFDDASFNLALKNPGFFKSRLSGMAYYKSLLSMYTLYHVRYRSKTPAFIILITLDNATLSERRLEQIIDRLQKTVSPAVRYVNNPYEKEMLWQIRRASYLLSKMQEINKRPAAFLEDMTVPPKNIAYFLRDIKQLLKKYHVTAAMHGHGGNGHFHFYPLLDFTNKSTPRLITKMSEDFFETAKKYDGSLCGEHNDGIIRTPYLNKMYPKRVLDLFKETENIFDPDDIFNPGKKTNPRYPIIENIREKN